MTIQRSFEILELEQGATLDDARQAYKDIANVWHPDRFSANPRLKHKAEQKLKEVNVAYETLKSFFQQDGLSNGDLKEAATTSSRQTHHGNCTEGQPAKARSRTEITAEAGTVLILDFCSYISAKLHHFVERNRP
ncbi:MAG: J domain-containing protein [Candidatus Desulfacyla sp.]